MAETRKTAFIAVVNLYERACSSGVNNRGGVAWKHGTTSVKEGDIKHAGFTSDLEKHLLDTLYASNGKMNVEVVYDATEPGRAGLTYAAKHSGGGFAVFINTSGSELDQFCYVTIPDEAVMLDRKLASFQNILGTRSEIHQVRNTFAAVYVATRAFGLPVQTR